MFSAAQHSIVIRAEGLNIGNTFEWNIVVDVNPFRFNSHVCTNCIDLEKMFNIKRLLSRPTFLQIMRLKISLIFTKVYVSSKITLPLLLSSVLLVMIGIAHL